MILKNIEREKINSYIRNLNSYIETKDLKQILYIDLGIKVVRLLCFSDKMISHIQKQLTYTIKSCSEKYDSTIVLWEEKDFENLNRFVFKDLALRMRVHALATKQKDKQVIIYDDNYSKKIPLLDSNGITGFFRGFDFNTNTFFYGVRNLEPEEFIKEGHIFVQMFNKILKTESANLVHGAVVGVDKQGVLICARGQRGKSTLAVLAMMKGFEYVSDDYLVLEKNGDDLLTYPIYSIITLSPRMYNELYDELKGSRFVSNNARKDKYVINIENFHEKFRTAYPVKMCLFPEIVSDVEPSIKICTKQEKGRAIVHLIHSTISQMQDNHDIMTVKKIINMVKILPFYKINLCNDINKNVEFLREFMEKEMKNDKLCIK